VTLAEPMISPSKITSRADAFRYRITFAKTDEMRYTSHLDVQRAWDRLLRRARLPLLYTQGFHVRARFSLASALPLGFTGLEEIAEIYLVEDLDSEALLSRIRAAAPPGLRAAGVSRLDPREPSIQSTIRAAEYRVDAGVAVDAEAVRARIGALLDATTVPLERRGKRYDLRPLVESVAIAGEHPTIVMTMRLAAREGATGRPDEVLRALDLDPTVALVCRERLILSGV